MQKLLLLLFLFISFPALAYLDLGFGSTIIQFFVVIIASVVSFISIFWEKVKSFFSIFKKNKKRKKK